ncbi:MAG: phosphoribosylformylglycinamidine synthase subunit PurS [Sulfurovaceae bacterium]
MKAIVELEATDEQKAREEAQEMSETLLANTVIEDFNIEIVQ